MNSRLTKDFVECFRRLPDEVKALVRKNYRLWRQNPGHRSLQFKCVQKQASLYSVRVGNHWRALGMLEGDTITWYWIGSHAEYDTLIS